MVLERISNIVMSLKVRHSLSALTIGKDFFTPDEGGRVHQTHQGFCFLRLW
jgi:hypothetical protein